jgi:hypothetical protein
MGVTKRQLDQLFVDIGSKFGGVKEDYFAVLYLADQFQRTAETVIQNVAFGGNDYGLDAFYIDHERRSLYLYQFNGRKIMLCSGPLFNGLLVRGRTVFLGISIKIQVRIHLSLRSRARWMKTRRLSIVYIFISFSTESLRRSKQVRYCKVLERSKRQIISTFS